MGSADGLGTSPSLALLVSDTPEEKLRRAFEEFDVDADGRLSADEFVKILTRPSSSKPLSTEEAQELIDMFDTNDDGRLSVEEFIEGWPAMCDVTLTA